MAGGSIDGASRLRIRHKPAIPHHQQIVESRSLIEYGGPKHTCPRGRRSMNPRGTTRLARRLGPTETETVHDQ